MWLSFSIILSSFVSTLALAAPNPNCLCFKKFDLEDERQNPVFLYNLGQCLIGDIEKGRQVCGVSPTFAVGKIAEAANRGHVQAQYTMGLCHFMGFGTSRDQKKAVEVWRKASEAGYPPATVMVGEAYEAGLGVERDLGKAKEMFERAYLQRDPRAKQLMARLRERSPELFGDQKPSPSRQPASQLNKGSR